MKWKMYLLPQYYVSLIDLWSEFSSRDTYPYRRSGTRIVFRYVTYVTRIDFSVLTMDAMQAMMSCLEGQCDCIAFASHVQKDWRYFIEIKRI